MAQQTISKMETVQTAVEWLIRNVNENIPPMYIPKQVVEQAKQMEKEQIKDSYLNACARVTPYGYYNDSAEQYYNETYNK